MIDGFTNLVIPIEFKEEAVLKFIRSLLPAGIGLPANQQPQTYAERLRGVMSWMLFGAGAACTAMSCAAVLIVWKGVWSPVSESQRLDIIGWALLGSLAGMGAVIVSLAIGGPVGRFKANVGKEGVGFDAEGRSDPPAPPVPAAVQVNVGGAPAQ